MPAQRVVPNARLLRQPRDFHAHAKFCVTDRPGLEAEQVVNGAGVRTERLIRPRLRERADPPNGHCWRSWGSRSS
jgi:hypothetical protein